MSEVIQAVLDGEYATIYAYGRAGGRLTFGQEIALLVLSDHRSARDRLRQWLLDDGVAPQPPAPAYELPRPVNTNKQARLLLASVESRLIPLYTELVADQSDDPTRRRWAVRQIQTLAVQAQAWGAQGQAFPWPADLPAPV